MAVYAYNATTVAVECTGTDISSAGIKTFLDANPTYGSCVASTAGPKDSYIFTLLARLTIGTPSSFKGASIWNCSNEFVTLICAANQFITYGRITQGNLDAGFSQNGGAFCLDGSVAGQFRINGGDWFFYGSSLYASQRIDTSAPSGNLPDVRLLDCDLELEDSITPDGGGSYNYTNSRIHHTGAVGLKNQTNAGATYNLSGLRIQRCNYAFQPVGTQTISDVKIDSCSSHVIPNLENCNLTFVNPDFTVLRASNINSADVVRIEFRYQLKVTDAAGAALAGISVRAADATGSFRFDTLTNASGNPTTFPSGTLQNSTYVGATTAPSTSNTVTRTDRAAHTIRVRHPQYLWTDLIRSATVDNLGDATPLVPDSLFTMSPAAAAAITGVTITDHGGSPVAWNSKSWGITITGDTSVNPSLTAADIFHYIRYMTSYSATFGGKSGLDWHNMLQNMATTVRSGSSFYAGVLKGVRVVDQAGNPFVGVLSMMADDGTVYSNNTITQGLAFTGLAAGSQVVVYETGTTTELFRTNSSGTTETWSRAGGTDATVDYTIQRAGHLPIRVVGVTVNSAVLATPVQQVVDRSYAASSGLTFGTTATVNTGTSRFTLTTATTGQNWYSFMVESWIAQSALRNVQFPLSSNGPNSFTLDGWEFSAGLAFISRDGIRYLAAEVATAIYAALYSVDTAPGLQVRYQQTDGGTTVNASNTGQIDQLIQVFGDAAHGNFDRRNFLALKVQADGFDQAETNAIATYGNLEDQLYVIGLNPVSNGLPTGAPTVNGSPTITDHGASPVTWNAKQFSITIHDSAAGNSGQTLMRWIRYNLGLGGTFQGKPAFNWHDLVQTNGAAFKTVRGGIYGDTGAALKGVRVVTSTGAQHPDFTSHMADDGTTFVPVFPANAAATILADSRVQLYNVTTGTEIDNQFVTSTAYAYTVSTGVTVGDTLRLRVCKLGRVAGEAFGIWTATGLTFLVSQPVDSIYNTWGIDGSNIPEFTGDVTGHIYIDANDLDGETTKTRLGAWYSWLLTTGIGITNFYGGVTYLSASEIRINVDVANILVENVNASTALRFTDTDVRLFRSDGSSIIAPSSYSIHNDYSGVPDYSIVTVGGVNVITGDVSTVLAAIPSAGSNASAVRSNLATELSRLDVAVSSVSAGSAPSAAAVATAVRSELNTELARIDVATSSRLSTSGYTTPPTPPTAATIADAVWAKALP